MMKEGVVGGEKDEWGFHRQDLAGYREKGE